MSSDHKGITLSILVDKDRTDTVTVPLTETVGDILASLKPVCDIRSKLWFPHTLYAPLANGEFHIFNRTASAKAVAAAGLPLQVRLIAGSVRVRTAKGLEEYMPVDPDKFMPTIRYWVEQVFNISLAPADHLRPVVFIMNGVLIKDDATAYKDWLAQKRPMLTVV